MSVQGPFVVINRAKPKISGTLILPTDAFKIALCTSAQAITAAFAGTSTNAQYSDLTAELATANGYTAGGLALSSVTWSGTGGTTTFTCANPMWTLTGGGITFKYAVIYDNTSVNKDLWVYCDMDTGGGSVSPFSGTLTFTISGSGIISLT